MFLPTDHVLKKTIIIISPRLNLIDDPCSVLINLYYTAYSVFDYSDQIVQHGRDHLEESTRIQ